MPKKILQDVISPENKSIRNIPLSKRRQSVSAERAPKAPSEVSRASTSNFTQDDITLDSKRSARRPAKTSQENYFTPPPKKTSSHKGVWITAVACLLVVSFAVSYLFVSAEVEITPKTETVDLVAPLVAEKSPQPLELGYQTVTLSKTLGKAVQASGEEKIEKKASGRIMIFNKNSKNTQRLIAGTRFQTSAGLIYKLDSAVTVPGYTTKAGEVVAGSVSATVTAEKAGDSYNIPLSDFTIPAFKGDPKFTNIFAHSDTAMQGGFSGTVKKVLPDTLSKTEDEINSELKAQLITEVKSQIPDSYILYPDAVSFTFESMPQTDTKETSVTVNQKGTITGVILDQNILNRELAENTKNHANPGEVYVSNLSDLIFSLPSGATLPMATNKDIPFTLKGQAHFVWIFDKEQIKKDLAGKSKKSLGSIISNYSSIEKAKATITPFWKLSFPSDATKISLKITTQ